MFFTYIIENQKGIFYKGSTSDYNKRLNQHNTGLNAFTKNKGPWKLIFVAEFSSRIEAEELERRLKRCNKKYLRWLINEPLNILNKSLDR